MLRGNPSACPAGIRAKSFEYPTYHLNSKRSLKAGNVPGQANSNWDQAERQHAAQAGRRERHAEHMSFRSWQNTTSPEARSVEELIPVQSGKRRTVTKVLLVREPIDDMPPATV